MVIVRGPVNPGPVQLDAVIRRLSARGGAAYAVQTAVNGGSELLIFVPHIRWKDDPAETSG